MNFEKPAALASVLTAQPSTDSIPLNASFITRFFDSVDTVPDDPALHAFGQFLRSNQRYANRVRLTQSSCPHALRAWAAERLPTLSIAYQYSNEISKEVMHSNIDEQAALWLVQFADDLAMIAKACRQIDELSILGVPHSHGMEFRFDFVGPLLSDDQRSIEDRALKDLLAVGTKRNALRNSVRQTEAKLSAESVILRKKVRLGFSPLS